MYSINYMCLNSGSIDQGRYDIIKKLGKGGFGTTYIAKDNNCYADSPFIVAIKEISISQNSNNEAERESDYIERLEREANALKDLQNHTCIPKFFRSFTENNCYYIVMEYIEGDSLSEEIRPGEPIGEVAAVGILSEMLDILQFVHQNNVIHRDIKPANIIRRLSDHKLVLIDFGAVKEIATKHTNASGMSLTIAIRTDGYTPIEQLNGQPELNSDIYALGITVMQGVTGFAIGAIDNSEKIPRRDCQWNFIWKEHAPQIAPKFNLV